MKLGKPEIAAILGFFFLSVFANAQATENRKYLDKYNEKTDSAKAVYYVVIEYADDAKKVAAKKVYHLDGRLKSSGVETYAEPKWPKREGLYQEFYDNGILREESEYRNGKLNGILSAYYPNGKLSRRDYLIDGEFVSGKCYSASGDEIAHFPYFQLPQFPGGDENLYRALSSKIKYPAISAAKNEEGRVFISFIVTETGESINYNVEKGFSKALDAEALRVTKILPEFSPALKDGLPIWYKYILPIRFQLR